MKHSSGRLEVICGSMFSGKTEELIRRVRRAIIARQKVQVFKPLIDNRYGLNAINSHNGQKVEAVAVESPVLILDQLERDTTVVAIDEVQFFDETIFDIVRELARRNIRVIMAGLDMDFRGEPFGTMPQLLCIAEDIMKLHAICVQCGDDAAFTQRLVNGEPAYYDDPIIMVGAQESYEARCRGHHCVPRREPVKI
ncbi:MAG: thymidine kinase [Aggregatilineales bacterium]